MITLKPLALIFGFTACVTAAVWAGSPGGPLSSFSNQRTWTDHSGRFQFAGSLEFAEAAEVRIRGSDGKLVSIKLDQLSDADRAFVKAFLEAEASLPAGSGQSPFRVVEESPASMSPAPLSPSTPASSRPQNVPASGGNRMISGTAVREVTPQQKGLRPIPISFEKAFWNAAPAIGLQLVENIADVSVRTEVTKEFFDSISVQAAGRSPQAVLGVYRQSGEENYSHFAAVGFVGGDASPVASFDVPLKLMAISPDGRTAAAVRIEGFDKGNDLYLLNVSTSGVVPRFKFRAGGGAWDELHWVQFLGNGRLATISQKHTVSVWDISSPNGVTLVSQGQLDGPFPSTSPAADQLAIIHKNAIAILDVQAFKQSGCILADSPVLAVDYAEDGQTLAVQFPYELAIYSLSDGQRIRSVPISFDTATKIRSLGRYVFVGDLLVDTQEGLPLWTYTGASTADLLGHALIAGYEQNKKLCASLTTIPHDAALRAVEDAAGKELYVMSPGTPIALEVSIVDGCPLGLGEVESLLEQRIDQLGWILNPSAPTKLVASVVRLEPKTEEYEESRHPFGIPRPFGFGSGGPTEKVTVIPWVQKIEVFDDGQSVFTNQRHITAPSSLRSDENETTQQAVNRIVQPRLEYFEQMNLPPHLYKPEYRNGFGQTKIRP